MFKINRNDPAFLRVIKIAAYGLFLAIVFYEGFKPFMDNSNIKVSEIRGTVCSADFNPLEGAYVEIIGTDLTTKTDNMGFFVINRVDEFSNNMSTIKLYIHKNGYNKFIRNIDVQNPTVYIHSILKPDSLK